MGSRGKAWIVYFANAPFEKGQCYNEIGGLWQRVDAFLRRSKRCGFCSADLPEFGELLEKCDDQLFRKIINNGHP